MFGKSAATIVKRRDAKLAAVETIMRIAERWPLTVAKSHKIPDDLVEANVQIPLFRLWQSLDAGDKEALRTGKGCCPKPPDVGAFPTATFLEFLGRGANHQNIHCYGTYTEDAYRWMTQVVVRNPHTFLTGMGPYQIRFRSALEALEGRQTTYSQNPTENPETLVEAKYLRLFLIANSVELKDVGWDGASSPLIWPASVNKLNTLNAARRSLMTQLSAQTPMFSKELAAGTPEGLKFELLVKLASDAYAGGMIPAPGAM